MADIKDLAPMVRRALDKAKAVRARTPGVVPKLDAIVAVLTTDVHDRNIGLTGPSEETPGSSLARRIRM